MQQASRVSKQRAAKTFPGKRPHHFPSTALLHECLMRGSLWVQSLPPLPAKTAACPLCLPLETCTGNSRAVLHPISPAQREPEGYVGAAPGLTDLTLLCMGKTQGYPRDWRQGLKPPTGFGSYSSQRCLVVRAGHQRAVRHASTCKEAIPTKLNTQSSTPLLSITTWKATWHQSVPAQQRPFTGNCCKQQGSRLLN